MNYNDTFGNVRRASRTLASLSDEQRSNAISILADLTEQNIPSLLSANARDLARMSPDNPLYDRLRLSDDRLRAIAADLRHVAALPTPVGEIVEERTLPNGILLRRMLCPFGVVGVIYEARPNVTFDVFSLCIKSGNACILKGGKDADDSNRAAIALIRRALELAGIPADSAVLLPADHEATGALLSAEGYVDLCIPRGGRSLIDFVRRNARVPVIETGAGVVHAFFHSAGDLEVGIPVIDNAKTRRVSVCNALDTLLIDRSRLADLPRLIAPLIAKGVEIHADPEAFSAMAAYVPAELLVPAIEADKDREWMDMKIGIFTVGGTLEAIDYINAHGSGHSETIISEDPEAQQLFLDRVDAACVYVNLPTSFTDGGQFGLGAEIGISTQKLGPRGPMALRALTTHKYLLTGHAQIRP